MASRRKQINTRISDDTAEMLYDLVRRYQASTGPHIGTREVLETAIVHLARSQEVELVEVERDRRGRKPENKVACKQ